MRTSMKKYIKQILVLFLMLCTTNFAQAKPIVNSLNAILKKSSISSSALISISIKEVASGKSVYEYNSKTPMNPASIQKIVTLLPSIETLGKDYEFKTQLYKNKDNNLYLKLGADPLLTSADLKNMVKILSGYKVNSTKAFYIDDSIIDSNEWGEGWQWDDDLNPLIPKFGAYNLDKNLLQISVTPTILGAPADITTNVFYPTAFINNIITGEKTDLKLERKNYISPDVINADGMISHDVSIDIPINYPRRYFILRLEEILRKQKIAYYGDYNRIKLPKDSCLVAETKHPLSLISSDILKRSNNMMAETVFKVAGGKYSQGTGTTDAAVEMLNDYYNKLGINTDNIKIVDGSGISKNNLLTADFITKVLVKTDTNSNLPEFKTTLAKPGEGTLTDRMLYFQDNLRAKTGTLTNISSIAGYLKAKSGKTYAFCVIINDSKSKSTDKKAFEEYVLREAFDRL